MLVLSYSYEAIMVYFSMCAQPCMYNMKYAIQHCGKG